MFDQQEVYSMAPLQFIKSHIQKRNEEANEEAMREAEGLRQQEYEEFRSQQQKEMEDGLDQIWFGGDSMQNDGIDMGIGMVEEQITENKIVNKEEELGFNIGRERDSMMISAVSNYGEKEETTNLMSEQEQVKGHNSKAVTASNQNK